MSSNIEQVRQMLVDTLADLRNPENPMEVDRARAIAQVASVLVDTARVEVDFIKATNRDDSQFLEYKTKQPAATPTGEALPGVTRVHRIR